MSRTQCPACGSFNSQREHLDFNTDGLVTVRTCEECPTEFTVRFTVSHKEVTYHDGSGMGQT